MAEKPEQSPDTLNNSIEGEMEEGSQPRSDSDAENKKRRTQTPSPNPTPMPAFMVAASPPKFISFEQLMSAANGVTNMTLAHEICVNNDFQLEKMQPQQNSVEKQVRDVMHKAFWDSLESKLNDDPPNFTHALVLIEEVKEALLMLLLPQHVRLRAQIHEVLDMDLIRQKMDNDAFDIHYYAGYVVDTMARLCAPVRDQQVAALKELKDIVPLFKAIFEVLELLKMDMANFTIQQIRPYLQQQSVDYERKKFTEFLNTQQENGTDGLEFTKLWLKRNFDKLLAAEKDGTQSTTTTPSPPTTATDAAKSSSAGSSSPFPQTSLSSTSSASSKVTPANLMNEAYLETLHWDPSNMYPETLVMDQGRFQDLEFRVALLTKVSAVQLVTYSSVGNPISGIASLKDTLKQHVTTLLEEGTQPQELKEKLAGVCEQVRGDVDQCLKQHSFPPMDPTTVATLTGQIMALGHPGNPIISLMNQRLMAFIKDSVCNRQRLDSLKVPVGFSAVQAELTSVLGQFLRLIAHNRSVFSPHYNDIIAHLMERQQDLSPR